MKMLGLRKCWGCSKKEEEEEGQQPQLRSRFKACSKCIQEKWVPAYFCSEQCLADHWPRHRAFHKAKKKSDREFHILQCQDVTPLIQNNLKGQKKILEEQEIQQTGTGRKLKFASVYHEQIYRHQEAENLMLRTRNYEKAERRYNKMIRADPRLPFGYSGLATVMAMSDKIEETDMYMEMALERFAFTILTSTLGDEELNQEQLAVIAKQWLLCLITAIDSHLGNPGKIQTRLTLQRYRLQFWTRDSELKRVFRYAKSICNVVFQKDLPGEAIHVYITNLYVMYVMTGIITNGTFDRERIGKPPPPMSRSVDNLKDAIECLQDMVRLNIKESEKRINIEETGMILYGYYAMMQASSPHLYREGDSPYDPEAPYEYGCWVIMRDLKSDTGKAMNGTLACVVRVVEKGKNKGRFGVKIDGVEQHMSVKQENLNPITLTMTEEAMLALVTDEQKWEYMRRKCTDGSKLSFREL